MLLYDNPDRGYRTTVTYVIENEHKVNGAKEDKCDLIHKCKYIDGEYVPADDGTILRENTASACYGKHDIRTTYANLNTADKQEIADYVINSIAFNTGSGKNDYKAKTILVQSRLPDYRYSETLPAGALEAYELLFKECDDLEARVLFRVGYHLVQKNMTLTAGSGAPTDAEREEAYVSKDIMLAHIEQLGQFLQTSAYGDVVSKISSGFIGSGGEMATNYQWPTLDDDDYNDVIKAIIDDICIPNGIVYTTRLPKYRANFLAAYPGYDDYIGINIDAVYGETEQYGYHSSCVQYNHNFQNAGNKCNQGAEHEPNEWWEYMSAIAAYTPQSGEMYHYGDLVNYGRTDISGLKVILQMAHHRYATFSQWNGYMERGNSTTNGSIMQNWIDNEVVTKAWLDENGIIYDPAWFIDANGNEITTRNPFEFLRDHLGYKLVAQDLILKGDIIAGGNLYANLALKNYGFAAAFGLESSLVILDANGNVVSKVSAGDPSTWYSLPTDYYVEAKSGSVQDDVLTHSVSANVSLPSTSGTYRLALLLENETGDTARLSNANEEGFSYTADNNKRTTGYNVLYTFTID